MEGIAHMIGPRMVLVRQHFERTLLPDIPNEIARQLSKAGIAERIKPGMKVAITAGSRGIANIPVIMKAVVDELKRRGAVPYIVPAMGSHGGATAEGQVEVLESLGITEAYCGAPIVSSMDVEQIGETKEGVPVYCDQHALSMDGIIVMGRVKVHTDFKSTAGIESGMMKMAAIGLGKHKQALQVHSFGVRGIRDLMPSIAEIVFERANIICGIGIVENAFEETALIEAVPTEQIRQREPELLQLSASYMPKLPVEALDLLIVDEIGKDYSGTGMDTNIIGRMRIFGEDEPKTPNIRYILASNLSVASHGNALGVGLADLTTRRLFDKIDFPAMNENVVTSTFLSRAMIPIVMDHDRSAIQAALRCSWGIAPEELRVARIPNTLHLEYIYLSENLLEEAQASASLEIAGAVEEMKFDKDGYLLPFPKA